MAYYPPYPPSPIPPSGYQGGAWTTLGYDVPSLNYQPTPTMGPWDLARALYGGTRLERAVFDGLLAQLPTFFSTRRLKEREARKAHRRIYVSRQRDRNSKHFGGAAAFHAFILWERDHHTVFHQYALAENRDRLVAMALGEVYSLFERMQPTNARLEEACEVAAATAKHLFDLNYDGGYPARRRTYSHGHGHDRHSYGEAYGYGHHHGHHGHGHGHHHRRYFDDSSDSDSERERDREREYRRRDREYAYHAQAQAQQAQIQAQAQLQAQQMMAAAAAYPPMPYYPPPAAAPYAYPPVQAVSVPPYPSVDPVTGYYRTDAYGNPMDARWSYPYGRY